MRMETTVVGNVLVIKPLDKTIDAASGKDFKEAVMDWVGKGHRLLVLDLANVDFVDSSGLGSVVSCLKALGSGGSMVVCGVQETVGSLFKLTRMNKVFKIFETQGEAVRALASATAS